MQAYYVTGRRNVLWYRLLGIARRIDVLLVLSKAQRDAAVEAHVPERKVMLMETCGFVDIEFFRSHAGDSPRHGQVCAIGREYRDYRTLFAAVGGLHDITLKVDANSPWSVHEDAVNGLHVPPNVEICHRDFGAVRDLYAEAEIVAIPLHPNDIGAGMTSLLEAMAMGKPVVLTRSRDGTYAGRRTIVDDENVLMVDPGDVEGWRAALARLAGDPALRERLAARGRQWIEENASRQRWLDMMVEAMTPAGEWNAPAFASIERS